MTRHRTLLLLMRLCFLMSEAREDILLPGGWKGPGLRPLKDMEERFLARRSAIWRQYSTVQYSTVQYSTVQYIQYLEARHPRGVVRHDAVDGGAVHGVHALLLRVADQVVKPTNNEMKLESKA